MNTGFYRGDRDEVVRENIRLLCSYAWLSDNVVGTPQIHSADIRVVTPENVGEGITRDVPYPCDGVITEHKGVTLIVRVADCARILLKGMRADGSHVVGAVHAGWRGAAAGIAPKCAKMLFDMGVTPGAEIYLRKKAPFGDPLEVNLRGYELTLRKAEAACVVMEVKR